MSAWIVDKTHIDMLVSAALQFGSPSDRFRFWKTNPDGSYAGWYTVVERQGPDGDHLTPDALGQLLADECVASVMYRYPDDSADELPGNEVDATEHYWQHYVYERPGVRLQAGDVYQLVTCYEYQSCEHPSWQHSSAAAFCNTLLREALSKMSSPLPWGIDAERLAKFKAENPDRVDNAVSILTLFGQ
jgi:hypothetical protein